MNQVDITYLEKRNKGIWTILAYLLIFNVLSSVIALIISLFMKAAGIDLKVPENYNNALSFINLMVYIALFIPLWMINKNDLKQEISVFKIKVDNKVLRVLAAYGIFYAINFFCNILVSNIEYYASFANNVLGRHELISSTADNQSSIEAILGGKGFIFMFLAAGILGPICEEIVFRKGFFSLFKSKELGLIVSSLCFAMIHITSSFGQYNFLSLTLMTMPYLFSGVAFGIIYIKNDCNLAVPTIVHMLSNIVSMIGILFLV